NRSSVVAACFAILTSISAANADLIISPTYDTSITSDPNSATIQGTINQAIQVYRNTFADNITVAIQFKEMSSGLGQTEFDLIQLSYSSLRAALAADAKTSNDAIALVHLPAGPNNPVDGGTDMVMKFANARAVGMNPGTPSLGFDAIISLNTSLM